MSGTQLFHKLTVEHFIFLLEGCPLLQVLHVMDVTFELCDLQQNKHPLPVFEIIAV